MNKPYDTAAILRQNVEDLERELQRQRERADVAISELEATRDDNHKMMGEILSLREQNAAATARLRDQIERVTSEWKLAESAMTSAREDLQLFVDSRDTWMARAMAAEAELKAAREQEPALFVSFCDDDTIRFWSTDRPKKSRFPIREFYSRPIPSPVVDVGAGKLAANAADTKHQSHVTRSSDSSSYDEKCVNCGATDISVGGWGELAKPCPAPAPAVSDSNPVQWLEDEGDNILVPRGLLGAACSAIDRQRHAPKVVAAMRYYTQSAAPAMPNEIGLGKGEFVIWPVKINGVHGLAFVKTDDPKAVGTCHAEPGSGQIELGSIDSVIYFGNAESAMVLAERLQYVISLLQSAEVKK